jgi:CO/xanthine dehydrogenase FAD-binding subunit
MKPAPFLYFRPASLEEALSLVAEHGGEAKPLAGGQSLIPAMNFRLARPAALVDLNGIAELGYIRSKPEALAIGAMTRQRTAERSEPVRRWAPLLSEALPFVAHPQIRNRGTVGGSVAHADPAAELPAVLLALEATFRVRSRARERTIPAAQFFKGALETALGPDELLVEITVPPPPRPAAPARSGSAFVEVARRHGDYALVGVAVLVTLDARGRTTAARIALVSVGDGPVLAAQAAALLAGETPTPQTIEAAAQAAAQHDIDPPADIHASAAYRRQLTAVLTRRALTRAFQRAREVPEETPQ